MVKCTLYLRTNPPYKVSKHLKAHQANDRAVMKSNAMRPIRKTDEAARVVWLMHLYQEKVGELGRQVNN